MARASSTNVTLDFNITEHGSYLIDIARCLSLTNRKSYRSGYVYSVDYMEYIGEQNDIVETNKLPEGYTTVRA